MTTLKDHIRESILNEGIFDFLKSKAKKSVASTTDLANKVIESAKSYGKIRFTNSGKATAATRHHESAFRDHLDGTDMSGKLDPTSAQGIVQSWGHPDGDQFTEDTEHHFSKIKGNESHLQHPDFDHYLKTYNMHKEKHVKTELNTALNGSGSNQNKSNKKLSGNDHLVVKAIGHLIGR